VSSIYGLRLCVINVDLWLRLGPWGPSGWQWRLHGLPLARFDGPEQGEAEAAATPPDAAGAAAVAHPLAHVAGAGRGRILGCQYIGHRHRRTGRLRGPGLPIRKTNDRTTALEDLQHAGRKSQGEWINYYFHAGVIKLSQVS